MSRCSRSVANRNTKSELFVIVFYGKVFCDVYILKVFQLLVKKLLLLGTLFDVDRNLRSNRGLAEPSNIRIIYFLYTLQSDKD